MILVTGATGLIGSYLLVELSRRGKKIRAMKRSGTDTFWVQKLFEEFDLEESFSEIEWMEGDLQDIPSLEQATKNIETVYHTAASVGFDDRKRKLMQSVNAEGTENLVNVCIDSGVKNLVYVSSIAVLDELPGENFITETSKWDTEKPHSEYAISKKKGEMAVWRGSQEGLQVMILYPSIVIGSSDGKRASERIFHLAQKKKTYSTTGLTGYVDVRDVAYCMVELAAQEKWNQSFILSSETKSFAEIFGNLKSKWNMKPPKLIGMKKLKTARFLSLFSKIFGGPFMSKASFQALTNQVTYSNEKVKSAININFIPVSDSLDFHADRWKKIRA